MSTPVRVRFAPSPTGFLHVGSIRSGLFNWLWARHNGGSYILRIEDTDQARLVEGATEQILATHRALGIEPDEGPEVGGEFGPYLQSQRLKIYEQHASELADKGSLYPCWCSPERLTQLREAAQKAGRAFKYDRHCLQPGNQRPLDEPHVLRFRIPDQPTSITWDDAVRGRLEVATAEQDDFVAIKTDGFPTYHFANVVDDHLMHITHVLRADEWLPSTPKHLLLFAAFGWDPPIYAHLPAVLGPSGTKKLSKRDGAQSVEEYLAEGYLPEALRSFLATLGWNDGTTQEVFSTEELVSKFTLDRVQKSPAQFDRERLSWVNGLMIRQMPPEELLDRLAPFWTAASGERDFRLAVLKLVQERLKTLGEINELTDFFFADPAVPADLLAKVKPQLVQAALDALPAKFDEASLEGALRGLAEREGFKTGELFGSLRIALTGRTAAPGLFETMAVLGKTVTQRRLHHALDKLSK